MSAKKTNDSGNTAQADAGGDERDVLAQNETLRGQLATANTEIGSLREQITALTAERDTAVTRATTADGQLTTVNANLASANTELVTLRAKDLDVTRRAAAASAAAVASAGIVEAKDAKKGEEGAAVAAKKDEPTGRNRIVNALSKLPLLQEYRTSKAKA